MSIKIEKLNDRIAVTAPYNTVFVDGARALAGKWSSPAWMFDIRDQIDVLALCMSAYGTDGNAVDQCDVRVRIEAISKLRDTNLSASIFGRPIAKAFGRDSGAKVGEGVIVESGGFDSGGSMKNPIVRVKEETVIKMRDVSRSLVEAMIANPVDDVTVEIISVNSNIGINDDDLIEELAMLEARVAEIKVLLSAKKESPTVSHNEHGIHVELADA